MFFCKQERQKDEMRRRHEAERERAQQQVEAENRKREQQREKELEQEREKLLKEKKNRQATEIASRPDLSDEELKAVSLHCEISIFRTSMTYHVISYLLTFIADGSAQAGVGKRSGAIRFGPTTSDAGHARETGVEPEEEDGRAAPEARE